MHGNKAGMDACRYTTRAIREWHKLDSTGSLVLFLKSIAGLAFCFGTTRAAFRAGPS